MPSGRGLDGLHAAMEQADPVLLSRSCCCRSSVPRRRGDVVGDPQLARGRPLGYGGEGRNTEIRPRCDGRGLCFDYAKLRQIPGVAATTRWSSPGTRKIPRAPRPEGDPEARSEEEVRAEGCRQVDGGSRGTRAPPRSPRGHGCLAKSGGARGERSARPPTRGGRTRACCSGSDSPRTARRREAELVGDSMLIVEQGAATVRSSRTPAATAHQGEGRVRDLGDGRSPRERDENERADEALERGLDTAA